MKARIIELLAVAGALAVAAVFVTGFIQAHTQNLRAADRLRAEAAQECRAAGRFWERLNMTCVR